MQQLDIAGVTVAYLDEGQGHPVILAHCSSGNHRMWSTLIRQLTASHRVLAPDLIGYGASSRWPEGQPYQPDADARLLIALAARAEAPVHLVGHSYGAAMALEAARVLGRNVRGLTLIEPVSFHLLKAGGCPAEAKIIEDVSRRTNEAVAAGDKRAASRAYMGFWLGRLRWWLAPKRFKTPVIDTVDKVAMEFAAIQAQTVDDLTEYQGVTAPTLLVWGERTRKPAKAVAGILAGTLPNVRTAVLAGAGHMSPFTHRDKVNALVMEHIAEIEAAQVAGA